MLKQELEFKGASFLVSKSVQSCSDVFLCYRGYGYILQEKNLNNRVETYAALRFQGINSQKLARQDIKTAENDGIQFRAKWFVVNTTL